MEMVSSHGTSPSCRPDNYSSLSSFPLSEARLPPRLLAPRVPLDLPPHICHFSTPARCGAHLPLVSPLTRPAVCLSCSFPSLPRILFVPCTPRQRPFSLPPLASPSDRVLYGLRCVPLSTVSPPLHTLLPNYPLTPNVIFSCHFLCLSPSPDFLTLALRHLSPALPSSACHVPQLHPYLSSPLLSVASSFLSVPPCPPCSSPSRPHPPPLPYLFILVSSPLSGISCP